MFGGGMEMMLKSFGIDPDEMKASIEQFKTLAQKVSEVQGQVNEKLSIIIINQGRMEGKLDELLSRGEEVQGKEEMAAQFAEMGETLPPVESAADFEARIQLQGSDFSQPESR
jgi:hypothetical protein